MPRLSNFLVNILLQRGPEDLYAERRKSSVSQHWTLHFLYGNM